MKRIRRSYVHVRSLLALLSVSTAAALYTPSLPHYEHIIPVRSNGTVCTNLTAPLTEAFRYNSSVLLQLSEGCFSVTSNELATFSRWTDFAIVGKSKDVSTLTCADGVGLSFLSSFGVMFRNVCIKGCGRVQTSTSRNFTSTSGRLSYVNFWVGVYFLSCGDVTMDHVEVRGSEGVGVVMYNCNGTNMFNHTSFVVNFLDDDDLYSSGGMAVEFSFCQPGDINCNDGKPPSIQVAQSSYTFYQCMFQANGFQNYQTKDTLVTIPYPHGTEHVAFGKGGGLSVVFKGRSSGNTIAIDSCTFMDNSAQWGGGLYTSFGDQSVDNKVTVANSKFTQNINYCGGTARAWRQSGGGAQIDFIYYPADNDLWPGYQPNVVRNSVNFYKTDFAANMACWGGAVSIVVSRESPGHPVTNSVLFDSCHFKYNLASIAAAVDVSIFQPDLVTSNGTLLKPVFKDCFFLENNITFTDATNFQAATGAVYANLVPLNFIGTTNFSANDGTALVVSGTYVCLLESSEMNFVSNVGRHGGAMAFIGNSWLVVHKNARVMFHQNSADGLGGAVYSVHFGEHDLMYKQNCFLQYYKATLPPSKWNATFKFSGNLARSVPNSIYTTSLLPCVWPSTDARLPQMNSTFCGHPFEFDTSAACKNEVSTGPSDLNLSNISITAVPGWKKTLPVIALNDFGNEIQTVYTASPCEAKDKKLIEVSTSTDYIADNTIVVHGMVNNSANLLLRTLDPKVISSQLRVDIEDCPPGYSHKMCSDNSSMVCDCVCTNSYGVGCDNDSHSVTVYSYNCLTRWYEGGGELVSGRCPFNLDDSVFSSYENYTEEKMCGGLKRRGTLCSQCKNGTGVNVNSYKLSCVSCDARYSWLLYIVSELVPIVFFFIIVAFFNVSVTSAPMNAFVFFSQIVTVPYFHNPYTFTFGIRYQPHHKVLEALVDVPYSIWNLDFFAASLIPGFCLDYHLTTLDVIVLKYINAFLPLILIIICYVLIELHGRNYRSIRFIWRPFRTCLKKIYKNQEPKTSIINAFATFLLLSYSKIMYVSFSLFSPSFLQNASGETVKVVFYFDGSQPMFNGKNIALCTFAIVIFVLTVVSLPLILLLYPQKCFQRIIDRLPFKIALRTFAEVFNGDFRDGTFQDGRGGDSDCRRYAGYYFIFRVVVFLIFVCELPWLEQYYIQQILSCICVVAFAGVKPYKEDFYNKVDTAFFLLLAILNACSFYNSQYYNSKNQISQAVFWINYLLIFVPLVYITCYVVYLIVLWKGCLKRRKKIDSPVSENVMITADPSSADGSEYSDGYVYAYNSKEADEDIPDRMLNPQNYNPRNLYRPHDETTALLREKRQQKSRQGSSEKSYFYGKKDRSLGSFSRPERHTEPINRPSSRARRSDHSRANQSGQNSSTKGASVHFQGVV